MTTNNSIEIKSDQDFWSGVGEGLSVSSVEVLNLSLSKDLISGLTRLSSDLNIVIDYALGYTVTIKATYEVGHNLDAEQTAGLNEHQIAEYIIDSSDVFLSPIEESFLLDDSHLICYPKSLNNTFKRFFISSDFTFHFSGNEEYIDAWSVGDESEDYKPIEWVGLYLDALSTPKSEADEEYSPYINDSDYENLKKSIKDALKAKL